MQRRIVLTGGGTGGHLFPLVAVAQKIREKISPQTEIYFMGPKGKLETEVMEKENIKMISISSGKLRRYFSLKNFTDPFGVLFGIVQSLIQLLIIMPDAIFSKGGFASVPVVIAARIYRIPVLIHESDAIPGLANRFLSRFCNFMAISYPSSQKFLSAKNIALTGNPIREEISRGDKNEARKRFNLSEDKPVVLVMGGSQGSTIINEAIVRIINKLLHKAQVIHIVGGNNLEAVSHMAGEFGIKARHDGYLIFDFLLIDDMKNAYAISDLIISRAGANSIAEIAANKKPSILIPLGSSANGHQKMNAYEIAQVGGALVLEESNLGENILMEKINIILSDEKLRFSMSEKIKTFYHPDASDHIVGGLIELINI